MAEAKQSKVKAKRPRKRNVAGVKGATMPREKALAAETPATEFSATDVPVAETTPAAETSAVEGSAAKAPATDEASEEEIRKAKELLRAHGYGLIGYRDAGEKVKRTVGAGLDFVKGKWKSFGGWLSEKRDKIKAQREEKRRAAAEKKRLEDEAAARHAETIKNELRLAELRVEEARLKTAANAMAVQPTVEPVSKPAAAEPVVASSDDSGVLKCASCGAELVVGARFCRKCGKPAVV